MGEATPRHSIAEVARRAGVSRSTVSRALRADPQISASTRERVCAIAAQLGYRPDPVLADYASANALRRQDHRPRHVVLAVADRSVLDEFRTGAFIDGIGTYAAAHHYALTTVEIDRCARPQAGIRGIILVDYGHHERNERFAHWLDGCDDPVIALSPNTYGCPYDAVGSNHVGAMHVALDATAARGYRRPGLLMSEKTDRSSGHAWSAAFVGWHARHGVVPPPHLQTDRSQAHFDAWLAEHAIDAVISRRGIGGLVRAASRSVGYVNLGVRTPEAPTTGLLQNYTAVGAAAMRHLDGAIRNFESGRPHMPQYLLVAQQWHEGSSLPWRE